uniref:Uncharacterized protein n=1 Tax=viral metagenome TaxID=1070528 RepID=A0A6C0BYX1_9ZZZZ
MKLNGYETRRGDDANLALPTSSSVDFTFAFTSNSDISLILFLVFCVLKHVLTILLEPFIQTLY